MKIFKLFLYAITVMLLCLMAFSCKTVKYVEREKIVVDSSAIIQNEGLQKTLHETIVNHEKEREQWEKTGVTFFEDEANRIPSSSKDSATWTTKTIGYTEGVPTTKIKFNEKGK